MQIKLLYLSGRTLFLFVSYSLIYICIITEYLFSYGQWNYGCMEKLTWKTGRRSDAAPPPSDVTLRTEAGPVRSVFRFTTFPGNGRSLQLKWIITQKCICCVGIALNARTFFSKNYRNIIRSTILVLLRIKVSIYSKAMCCIFWAPFILFKVSHARRSE